MKELKKIDLSAGPFQANGKLYSVAESFSFDRFKMYENIEIEMGYGSSWADIHAALLRAYDSLNKGLFADGSVQLYNIVNGVKNIKNKIPHALKMCALFINYEGEDVRIISNQIIEQKIYDWNQEGLDPEPFLAFGVTSTRGLIEHLKNLTQDSFQNQQEAKQTK